MVKPMYIPLIPGLESHERMVALVTIMKKTGPRTKAAILDRFVLGWPVEMAAAEHGLLQGNLSRTITRMIDLHKEIHEFNIS